MSLMCIKQLPVLESRLASLQQFRAEEKRRQRAHQRQRLRSREVLQAQLRVAAGEPLPWADGQITLRGSSIECRIYAEDPVKGFMPSPGRLTRLVLPQGPGVRLECGVAEGVEVSVHYDPLVAKLIATGRDRDEAIARMAAALDAFVVEGVKTTIPFHQRVMRSDLFRAGSVHTQLIEQGAFS